MTRIYTFQQHNASNSFFSLTEHLYQKPFPEQKTTKKPLFEGEKSVFPKKNPEIYKLISGDLQTNVGR